MTANVNPDTGIAYGYISANALHPDIVNELQMEGTDVHYEDCWQEFLRDKKSEYDSLMETRREQAEEDGKTFDENMFDAFDPEDFRDEFNDSYQPDEPIHEGEKDGVKYRTSWLGGALNVFIFESPYITETAGRASPCVPNAGILDSVGDVRAYDVPPEWREVPELYDADPNCVHIVKPAPGGGIKCMKCPGWFCY